MNCQAKLNGAQCVINRPHMSRYHGVVRMVRVEVAGAMGVLKVATSWHRTISGRWFAISVPATD